MVISADTLRLALVPELQRGITPPAPAFMLMRVTSEGIAWAPTTTNSNELTPGRGVKDSILTGSEVTGDINYELTQNPAFEHLLGCALGSDWGQAGNRVGVVVGPNDLVVNNMIRPFTVEKRWALDESAPPFIYSFHRYRGLIVNTASLAVAPGSPITGTFGLLGMDMDDPASAAITGATYEDAGQNPVFTAPTVTQLAFQDAGGNPLPIAINTHCFSALTINVNNNARNIPCIGFMGAKQVVLGRCEIGLDATLYFADDQILTMLRAQTVFQLVFEASDGMTVAHKYRFTFPRVKLLTSRVVAGGTGQDVTAECTMSCTMPATDPISPVKITRTPGV